jgi:serine protease Do
MAKPQGALVGRVVPEQPAAKAGVEPGDIILRFAGKPIEVSSDLPRAVGGTKPNTTTSITVLRRGKQLEFPITVSELEPQEPKAEKAPTPPKPDVKAQPTLATAASLGLGLADLTDEQKKELKLSAGARIEGVTGPAASAGLREGDVIVAISNQEVARARDAESILAKQDKTKPIALQIRRGDRGNFVLLKPPTAATK